MTEAERRQAWRRWLLRGATMLFGLGCLAGALALFQPAEEANAGAHAALSIRAAIALIVAGLALSIVPLFIRRRTPTS